MNDFKLPESYYQPPEFKCEYCERHEDECDCCLDCESVIEECACNKTSEEQQDDLVVSFRLDKDIHKDLKEVALHHERTISQIIRFAIRDYLNNGGKK